MSYTPGLPDESVNYSAEHPLKELLWLCGGLFALTVAVYFVLGASVDLLAERISPEFEKKLSVLLKPSMKSYEPSGPLTALAASLETCSPLPYPAAVYLSETKEINAFALPGGMIVLNRGLLEQCGSENELLFVLAHEMGHITHRDHLRGMGRALAGISLSALLGLSEAPPFLGEGLNFGESRFSQAQEEAADLHALEMLQCRYGHVAGATDFFERNKENDPARWFYFASHPALQHRIDRLDEEARLRHYPFAARTPLEPAFTTSSETP